MGEETWVWRWRGEYAGENDWKGMDGSPEIREIAGAEGG
jgi:hypothetical protein